MKKMLIVILVILFFSALHAEDDTNLKTEEKIDSIYVLQKKIYQDVKDQPLQDKKYGVEFNFFRLLFFGSDTNMLNHTLSGTFSLFYPKKKIEIAFPFFYSDPVNKWDAEYIDDKNSLRQITLDCHYRKFLGNSLNKFYISGFVRYANLKGYEGSWFDDKDSEPVVSTENKIGIGIGVGYRIFSYSGFYWGTSISLGRYIIGENGKFYGDFFWYDNDNEIIFNFEFLKFGYAF